MLFTPTTSVRPTADSPPPQSELAPTASSTSQLSATSKRLRLFGFARATRDTYLPRLTTSVTLLATGVTQRLIEYDEFGSPLVFPKGTTFTLFPTYTRPVTSATGKGYMVSVRGWMWCPGVMSRKNRLILSLAKQITKYGGGAALAAVDRLEHDPALRQDSLATDQASDVASISSGATSGSSGTFASGGSAQSMSDTDKLIRDRLSSFTAKLIPKAQLNVIVGAADTLNSGTLEESQVFTDNNGNFETEIFVPYEPSVVQVTAAADETICTFKEIRLVSVSGYGLISDIDDTVKLTGVIGDKRELMHRLLLGDLLSWNIPPVIAWYKALLAQSDITFHYVSNSPWQLFSLISQYFDAVQLPPGSVHLKQYTGNIISSLMEPSSSRKKKSLFKIAEDFPEKKFICVGDSGERDLEAYADLAASFPGKVRSIYIRVVQDSLSDVDDANILGELNWIIEEWTRRQEALPVVPRTESTQDLIDLSDPTDTTASVRAARLPPLIPKKPVSLKGITLSKPPPLPDRKYLVRAAAESESPDLSRLLPVSSATTESGSNVSSSSSGLSNAPPPPPPPRRRTTQGLDSSDISPQARLEAQGFHIDNLNGAGSFYELEEIDKTGAEWLERVTTVLHQLDGSGTKVRFFKDSDDHFFAESLQDLD